MPVVMVGLFGSLIGSFLNVVIFRVPAGRSIVSPPSACGSCGSLIRGYDNIPVVSWLLLRGRCRTCKAAISPRYPLVELGTAVAFAAVTAWVLMRWGMPATLDRHAAGTAAVLLAFLYLAAISIALALIDLDTHRLPNRIVLPVYVVGGVLLGAGGLLLDDGGALIRAAIGLASLWTLYFLVAMVYPGGMGFGDVKLAGVLGLYLGFLGWPELIVGAFGAFLLGGLYGIGLLVARRASRSSGIPFGPWMLAGAWCGIIFGAPVWASYLALFGLS